MAGPSPAVAEVRVAVRHALTGPDAPAAGDLVVVACSGGADSLALLAAACFEGPRAGLRIGSVTVDHAWAVDSAPRTEQVVAAARALGADPATGVAAPTNRSEEAARTARYAALDAEADRIGAGQVLLGHTLDDQAETVLLGLARGSGARSLAGMPPVRGRFRRPLLGVRRATTRAAAEETGVPIWDDPANADRTFARARVRHDLLPAMEDALGPGVADALARTARLLADDGQALDRWATCADPGTTELDVTALASLPAAVRARVLRSAALRAGVPPGALNAGHIAAVDALVTHWHGQGPVSLPDRLLAARACGRLTFKPEQMT